MRDQNNHYKIELEKLKAKVLLPERALNKGDDHSISLVNVQGQVNNSGVIQDQTSEVNRGLSKFNNMYSFGSNSKLGNAFTFNRNFKRSNIVSIRQLQNGNGVERPEVRKTDKKAYEDMINRLKSTDAQED